MWNVARLVVEEVYGQAQLYGGIYSVLWTGLAFGGGLAVWWAFSWFLEYLLLGAERATIWVLISLGGKDGKYAWSRRPRAFGSSLRHLVLQIIFLVGVVLIFWIACGSSGFNPWTTGAATLGMSIFLTYVFITPLGLLGSSLALMSSGMLAPDQYWEFPGYPGYDGRIIGIYTLQVEMERWDIESLSTELVTVPIGMFLSGMCKRNMNKERNTRRYTATFVAQPNKTLQIV
jgi:hypothetical protein